MTAGLAPLYRRGMDPAEGLTADERIDFIEPLRRRQAELRARPTPPMIRIDEIDECIRIVVIALLKRSGAVDLDLTGPQSFEVSTR